MRMALFISTTVNKVDRKSRVSVPSSFRHALQGDGNGAMALWPRHDLQVLDGCDQGRITRLAASIDDPGFLAGQEDISLDIARIALADARMLNIDGNGRIVLPDDFRAHANIEDRVVFVGMGAIFQMWNPNGYARWRDQKLQTAKKKGLSVNLRPLAGSGS